MAIHGTLCFRVVHAQSLRLNPKSRNAEKEEMLVPIHCGQSLLWFPVDTLLPTFFLGGPGLLTLESV